MTREAEVSRPDEYVSEMLCAPLGKAKRGPSKTVRDAGSTSATETPR